MFFNINLSENKPIYLQIKDYIKEWIVKGMLQKGERLPATRELSEMINVSRNTVIAAYEYLEEEGFVYTIKGKGVFVSDIQIKVEEKWQIDWSSKVNEVAKLSEELDIKKQNKDFNRELISFRSISPDPHLFNVEEFKRAFLNRMAADGENILNYGYAKGYKPLIEYLLHYMENKGVDSKDKDLLVTNGFTEGFDMILSCLTEKGDIILCENPTHNTALKIMRLHGLNVVGIEMEETGIHTKKLRDTLKEKAVKLIYLIPSYHNPTGVVMTPEKRIEVYDICREYGVAIIEDGFNEELRYSGAHIAPLIGLCGDGNSVIYIGSFSKILFPGMRIGWILGDKRLISYLESMKRSRNIHTSLLDQAVLFEYLRGGDFEKYIKKARKVYGEKYNFAVECAKKYIPYKKMYGEGGLHIFIELNKSDGRAVLKKCIAKGITFTTGDVFHLEGGENTLRLGFSRVTKEEIERGFKIIGEVIKELEG